jgi:acyl dehydratase
MPINPDAVGATGTPQESSWSSKDALLYALGVGAGMTDPTGFELEFTTENTNGVTQLALPTMCVVLNAGFGGGADSPFAKLGSFNPAMLVHGEQGIRLHKPLPVAATISSTSTITGIYDKGKAALVVLESTAVDTADNQPLFTNVTSLFIRGEGGWGGDRGPSGGVEFPDRPADHVVSYQTRPDQALLYRLNGDRNPLHSDPSFAALGGFDKPILHGLCTYGFTGRALLHAVCGSDPARFKSMDGRFSSPVLPGEQLDVHIWEAGDHALFRTMVGDRVVIDGGRLGL